ncbi:MAG: hypothetical protein SGBAC_004356 [Bacillariaceae sp.]
MTLMNQSFLSLLLLVPQIEGFQAQILPNGHHHITAIPLTRLQAAAAAAAAAADGNDQQEQQGKEDLFDPLLSPHAYPNGIDAGPSTEFKNDSTPVVPSSSLPPLFQQAVRPPEAARGSSQQQQQPQQQDNDVFDPLLSPHAYPNGIDAGPSTEFTNVPSPPSPLEVVPASSQSGSSGAKRKLGVLLMDHGSRNAASNTRLEKMAELYQLTSNYDQDDNGGIVVEAAHMEIASPSIAEGLKKLLDQGVDEIVCHPYFLSPGRHVTEDIPELLEAAKNELKIDIPIVCTKPVGANTQLMIGAIHALVQENSSILRNQNQQQ